MRYHTFNIGEPHVDAWWLRNLQMGIITAGFSGEAGDRGDVLLHQLDEGDWILAYSNGHGFVGAGRVAAASTYRLLSSSELPDGWEATHRHLRQVDWVNAVLRLEDGLPAGQAGRRAPRQTKEEIPRAAGLRLIKLLAARSSYAAPKRTRSAFNEEFAAKIEQSSRDDSLSRLARLRDARKLPYRVAVVSYEFVRNPDVVAEVLCRADGRCERCGLPAPFIRRKDGTPYLEVHHTVRLVDGGEDTIKNAVAICPNCHRELHHGEAKT